MDWAAVRRNAARLGLFPPMLWRSTLRDLHERQMAFLWHQRRDWERTAQLAHWLLSAWVENAPNAKQLLGDTDPADSEAALDRVSGVSDSREQSLAALDRAYAAQPPKQP